MKNLTSAIDKNFSGIIHYKLQSSVKINTNGFLPTVNSSSAGYMSVKYNPCARFDNIKNVCRSILILSLLVFCFVFLFSGCKAIEEFTHMKALEISSFSPSSSRVNISSLNFVKITFSEEMDKSRTEQAFTLKNNSSEVNGIFSWNGNTLSFIPFAGFKINSNYSIEVSVTAEDIYGNSLPEKFVFPFSTSEESDIPYFISSVPADHDEISDSEQIINLEFSEPLMPDSVYSSFSIFPDIKGHLALDNGKTNIVFTPLEKYTPGSDYTVTVSDELSDLSGNRISSGKEIFFRVAEEDKAILTWFGSSGGTEFQDTAIICVNSGLEKNEKLKLVYDSAVPDKVRETPFSISPDVEYTSEWNTSSTEAVITFRESLKYNEIYEITLEEKKYRLLVNGSSSKPPVLNRIVYCEDSEAPVFVELTLNKGIPFKTSENAFFDFYFTLADTACLNDSDIFSCISFRTVNGDLSVNPLRVENPQSGNPAPSPDPVAGEYVFRIECSVTDGTEVSPFRIEISSDFRDSLSNRVEEEISIQVTSL